jgi:hypothetical protein
MDIRSQIFESSLPIAHDFAVHHPLLVPDAGGDERIEFCFLQGMLKSSAKRPGKCFDGQKEFLICR